MPLGDVPGWHQVFADDFSAPAPLGMFSGCLTGFGLTNNYCSGLAATPYLNRWFAYPDGWAGIPQTGTYAPSDSMSVEDGALDYYLHSSSSSATGGDIHMIDVAVPKLSEVVPSRGLLYGRYVVRARWDALSSYHISFLLWPDSERWPQDGEIDYPEANMASHDVSGFMHRMNGTARNDQAEFDTQTDPQQWDTYEIDWMPSDLSFYLDGELIGALDNKRPEHADALGVANQHIAIGRTRRLPVRSPADRLGSGLRSEQLGGHAILSFHALRGEQRQCTRKRNGPCPPLGSRAQRTRSRG